MNNTLLSIQNITKDFIGVRALEEVSLCLNRGEILAIMGENGAGKTTLMKILSGVHACSSYSGTIIIDNEHCKFASPKHSENAGIEMIYQEICLVPDLSVAENIYAGNYPTIGKVLLNRKQMFKQAQAILEQLNIKIDVKEKIRNLTTSQQQLVSIAKALSKKAKILILDEPTSAITATETDVLFENIRKLRDSGISCIYISHKLDEVLHIADRIVVMRNGKVVGDLNKENFDGAEIVRMMVGRSMEERYPKRTSQIGDTVLEVRNLSVENRYLKGENKVNEVSFTLKKGEILGLAGLVGSGRSELANAIFGSMEKRPGGTILIDGKETQIKKPSDAIDKGIALITEDRKLTGIVKGLSVRENITLAMLKKLFPKGIISYPKEWETALRFKERLSIKAPSVETKVKNLSGGNQQKVVISKWLLHEPSILFMDEPTRGIDVGAKFEIYNLMNELSANGAGIVMISSEMPELIGMCDRILVLCKGEIVGELYRAEASEEKLLYLASGTNKARINA